MESMQLLANYSRSDHYSKNIDILHYSSQDWIANSKLKVSAKRSRAYVLPGFMSRLVPKRMAQRYVKPYIYKSVLTKMLFCMWGNMLN